MLPRDLTADKRRHAAAENLADADDDATCRSDHSDRRRFSGDRPCDQAEQSECESGADEQQPKQRHQIGCIGAHEQIQEHRADHESGNRHRASAEPIRQAAKPPLADKAAESDRRGDKSHVGVAQVQIASQIRRRECADHEYPAHRA